MDNSNLPKKISIADKIRKFFRDISGYRAGKEFMIDTPPYIKKYSEIELMKIADIEYKVRNKDSISMNDARILIEWVVQNDREIISKEGINVRENSLLGICGLSQGITCTQLKNMGLNPRVSNINPTISGKSLGGHGFCSVGIPIKNENGEVNETNFLIDATYRQFFLRNEVTLQHGLYVKDKKYGNKVAPLAGYWCLQLPGGKKFAKEILSTGFVELNEENAKLYGDSFILEQKNGESEINNKKDKNKEMLKVPKKRELNTKISGNEYIKMFTDPNRQDYRGIDYDEGELERILWRFA